ncbi:hypothetical protein FOL47_009025 [Perkinsus chesapeaki]|uniref:U-box domain-containing protein n=1 Tax=Perkinsus chesapeaki TaxID=330153 RepID=A0A7J6LB06_PERCH|nr:hypothetical protein FOL47_009025 [Perkinsus chesapeaki]
MDLNTRTEHILTRVLRITLDPQAAETHKDLDLVTIEGTTGPIRVDILDEVFVARLSQLGTLNAQLSYMIEVYNRIEDEANRSYRGDLQNQIHEAAIKPLRECHIRYLSMVLQCPELFGRSPCELYVSGAELAQFVNLGQMPMTLLVKLVTEVHESGGLEVLTPLILPVIGSWTQKIVHDRGHGLHQCAAVPEAAKLGLLMKQQKVITELVTSLPVWYTEPPPAPRMPNDRRPPQNKNASELNTSLSISRFHLQETTILGKMLSPSSIDHNLLDPQEVRAQQTAVIDQTLQLIQPALRANEKTRVKVLFWFASALTNSAQRATMGWQNQNSPNGAALADQLLDATSQLHGNLERFRMLSQGMLTKIKGVISTGCGLNAAWVIFELCLPIKLEQSANIDCSMMISENPEVKTIMGILQSEAKMGDADTIARIPKPDPNRSPKFVSQIFWQAVQALHIFVCPALKEAETMLMAASVFHQKQKMDLMADGYGEYHCYDSVVDSPRFVDSLAHCINLMMSLFLIKVIPDSVPDKTKPTPSGVPQGVYSLNIMDDSSIELSDDMAVLPTCIIDDIVDVLHYYRNTSRIVEQTNRGNRGDIFNGLDCDLLLLFVIWTLGSEKCKNPSVRGQAAKGLFDTVEAQVLKSLSKQPRFARQIENADFCVRNIVPACIRVFTAVEKTKQSYYDIRMHVKFELRIPIQKLFEQVLPLPKHRAQLQAFAVEQPEEFCKFVNQLLNDTTYLLDEGLDSLTAIRKHEAHQAAGSSDEPMEGTAGLGVERAIDDEDEVNGQDMYRRSRTDAKAHCKQYMSMGHQTVSTLHAMCKEAANVILDDRVVLEQMLTSCLDPCIDRLVGPKCLELKGKSYDFNEYNFDPKDLLRKLAEMYVYLARGGGTEKISRIVADDQRYYSPQTFNKAVTILRRERLLVGDEFKEFEAFVKHLNETASKREEAMDNVEIPDNYLDPIMAEVMIDPVKLPGSGQIMDRRHIVRIILSDDHDPFTREPLNPVIVSIGNVLRVEDLEPLPELKAEIHAFCKEHNIELDEELD